MFEKLKRAYPSLCFKHQISEEDIKKYNWFITDDHEIIGIHRKELSKKDEILLSTFLTKYNPILPPKTNEEQYWYNLIHKESNIKLKNPFRFVYFIIPKIQIEPLYFKNILMKVFGKQLPVLWENETTGIIIETISESDEQIDYRQVSYNLMADLSILIKFYIGEQKNDQKNLYEYYQKLIYGGNIIFRTTGHDVINYIESLPYLLLDLIEDKQKHLLLEPIIDTFRKDEEMQKTLVNFFQHNLNISETAKNMYMHRNSLQYRIDKFINETGIDIQKFDLAFVVKLALITYNSK